MNVMRGIRATTNIPGFERCNIFTVDSEGKVWGVAVNLSIEKAKKCVGRLLRKPIPGKGRNVKRLKFNRFHLPIPRSLTFSWRYNLNRK